MIQQRVQYSWWLRNRLHVLHFLWQSEQNQSEESGLSQDPHITFSAEEVNNGEEGGEGK